MGESSGLEDKSIAENQKLSYAWLMSNRALPRVGTVGARAALRMQPKKREDKLCAL
jgi:hypothetical protein